MKSVPILAAWTMEDVEFLNALVASVTFSSKMNLVRHDLDVDPK